MHQRVAVVDDPPTRVGSVSGAPSARDDDATLVALARHDRDAFGLLYDRYLDRVYRYCYRRLGSRETAEDAASAVFIKVLSALPNYQERAGGFRSWLFTIAHNVVTDSYRDWARRPTAPLDDALELIDSDISPEEAAIASDDRRHLDRLIAQLTPDQQRILELRLAGLTGPEIGEVLGRTRGAVNLAQHRAMKRLQRLVSRKPDAESKKGGDR